MSSKSVSIRLEIMYSFANVFNIQAFALDDRKGTRFKARQSTNLLEKIT